MTVRPDEVASIIKQEIERYEDKLKMESVGTVLRVGMGLPGFIVWITAWPSNC